MDLDPQSADAKYCGYEIFPGDSKGPAEYCFEDAEDGSEYCLEHNPDRCEPDWDDRRKDMLVGAYDCYD